MCDFDAVDVRHLIALSWDLTFLLGTWVYSSDSGLTQAWIHSFCAHGDAAFQAFRACGFLQ